MDKRFKNQRIGVEEFPILIKTRIESREGETEERTLVKRDERKESI